MDTSDFVITNIELKTIIGMINEKILGLDRPAKLDVEIPRRLREKKKKENLTIKFCWSVFSERP